MKMGICQGARRNRKENRGRDRGAKKEINPPEQCEAPLTLCCEADPDQWFSEAPEKVAKAKAACDKCPVRNECAELGEYEEYGIFGGMTPEDRRNARHFRVIMLEELTNNRIRSMHSEGVSISAMSRELGIPRKTLADRLRRMTGLAA